MKKLLYLMLLNSFISISQNKPEIYYNENFKKIPKDQFEYLLNKNDFRANQYDLEDQIANILYKTKIKGKLTEEEFKKIKSYLNKTQQLKDGLIVIIFYPGKDNCNKTDSESGWTVFDKDYQKELKKQSVLN